MSRIGKKPIEIPKGVEVKIDGNIISVNGPKGLLSMTLSPRVSVSLSQGVLMVSRQSDDRKDKAIHGTTRAIIANMVKGVSTGFEKILELSGVGYRSQTQGNKLIMSLGYSHSVEYVLPENIRATVDQKQTTITLTGIDKQLLGQVAAEIRSLRSPDAYKGKGIRYAGEQLKLKPGKAGKK